MDPLPGLRSKNTAATPAKDGAEGLSALLPQVQTRAYHKCAKFSNRNHQSARRKDAVLTAIFVVTHCIFLGGKP